MTAAPISTVSATGGINCCYCCWCAVQPTFSNNRHWRVPQSCSNCCCLSMATAGCCLLLQPASSTSSYQQRPQRQQQQHAERVCVRLSRQPQHLGCCCCCCTEMASWVKATGLVNATTFSACFSLSSDCVYVCVCVDRQRP